MQEKVLVVEDEAISRVFLQRLLEDQGYTVDFAYNGQMGVEKFQANYAEYCLVITDIGLPDMTGVEAVRQMRMHEQQHGLAKAGELPIYALSSHMDKNIKQQCLRVGMKDAFHKPIKAEEIKKVLKAVEPCAV